MSITNKQQHNYHPETTKKEFLHKPNYQTRPLIPALITKKGEKNKIKTKSNFDVGRV